MLSICITIKNHSRVKVDEHDLLLFPNCVTSIVESIDWSFPCEIVVADWESDDCSLNDWLEQTAKPISVSIINVKGEFSRGKGRNLVAIAAKGDYLFFLDADSLLCKEVINSGIQYLSEEKAFFLILFSFDDSRNQSGWWRNTGYGNCMVGHQRNL